MEILTLVNYKIRVWGEQACYVMAGNTISCPVITPATCRGILESIYAKPEMYWQILRVYVVKRGSWDNIKLNEIAKTQNKTPIVIEKNRVQRHYTILRDVEYVIEARIIALDERLGKHCDIFERRIQKGCCYKQPFLGRKEMLAYFELVDHIPQTDKINYSGCVHYGVQWKNEEPIGHQLVRINCKNGIYDVPELVWENV
jgi:CRISPR-associated protein Cas5d